MQELFFYEPDGCRFHSGGGMTHSPNPTLILSPQPLNHSGFVQSFTVWILKKFPPVSGHGWNSQGNKHHSIFPILLISSWEKTFSPNVNWTGCLQIDNLLHSHPKAVLAALATSLFGKCDVLFRRIVVGWTVASPKDMFMSYCLEHVSVTLVGQTTFVDVIKLVLR